MKIKQIFLANKEKEFKEYLNELFKKISNNDQTGAWGSITYNDYQTMTNFIFDNYAYFYNVIQNLKNNNEKNAILIDITRSTDGLYPDAISLVYHDDIKTKSSLTLKNNAKLDISSLAKLSDTVSSSGKSILKFKIQSELRSNLLTARSGTTQITQKERNNINEKISRYIKLIIREKNHEKILEINNSLTENDYDIIFKYPNNTIYFNPLNTRIVIDFIITGKNNAIGKVEQELIIDAKN